MKNFCGSLLSAKTIKLNTPQNFFTYTVICRLLDGEGCGNVQTFCPHITT